MPEVNGLIFYLGNSPAAKNARAAPNLMLDDDGMLCQSFRRSLLKSQTNFSTTISISELPPMEVSWTGIGETAGVALWRRDGKVGAASILLNGIEPDQELKGAIAYLAAQQLRLPPNLAQQIAEQNRPLLITVHYDLRSFTDPTVITAAEALANAFFTMFGTNG